MNKADYNTESELQVSIYTQAGTAVTGLEAADVTCYYKKYGDSTWTSKTLDSANWREDSDSAGTYYITFTGTEMNTYGYFSYRAHYGVSYGVGVVNITDYADEAAQLQEIYDLMATKVDKADLVVLERDKDNVVTYLSSAYDQLLSQFEQLSMEVAGMNARIAAL